VRIEDYALIGDMHTAALVGLNGSIDWFCAPRFDSGAIFAALLGDRRNGCWLLGPTDPQAKTTRAYRPDSMVLETTHDTPSGTAIVIDWMAIHAGQPVIARKVECLRGEIEMQSLLAARFDYGNTIPWAHNDSGKYIVLTAGPDAILFASDVPHERDHEHRMSRARFRLGVGEHASMQCAYHDSYRGIPSVLDLNASLQKSDEHWKSWAKHCTYKGEWREQVMRSLLTLKALTFAPTGGILAAATTSLPETIGGERNWDYRFCWLRDATFTLLALIDAGYHKEAIAWRDWLLRAVAGDPSQLQVLYGVAGERRIPEFEIPWLSGYEGSLPVRIGNAASGQFQLDIFGEVVDALMQMPSRGEHINEFSEKIVRALVDFVDQNSHRTDSGMWEIRGETRLFTHSRVMAWAAFDRGTALVERLGDNDTANRWRLRRDELRNEVLTQGFDDEIGAFVQCYGSKKLDASTLLIPHVGFLPATDPRVVGTVAAIERDLLEGGYVLRYLSDDPRADGLHGHDNVFLACSFWLADTYALMGRHSDARNMFRRLLALSNDVGLLSEEYDVDAKRAVGNVPQAFSHVGLVTTALNIDASLAGTPRKRKRMSPAKKAV
jgi:GH15 family glucan-1,4-alpha-glucosidase